jgi:hypothetical protein
MFGFQVHPAASPAVSPRRFYHRWVAACTGGELIGIGVATAAALLVNAWLGEPQSLASRLGVLALFAMVGLVEGGALAWLEWRVLRTRLPRLPARQWVGVTAAVAIIGWIVGMTPSLFVNGAEAAPAEPPLARILLMAAMAGGAAGLCFGAAQWLVLRRYAERAHRWIWIHLPAWALAMAAIFLGAALPGSDWEAWMIGVSGVAGGALGGSLLGVVTGVVAESLMPCT